MFQYLTRISLPNIRLTGNAQLGAHLAERSDCKMRDNARYPVEAVVL